MADTPAKTREPDDELAFHDFSPERERFLADVLAGLGRERKELPCKYFYDERGSRLFDRICELEEYYPTRTELAIMEQHAGEMAEAIGPGCLLVEYGSGSSLKTRLLIDRLEAPVAYVPVDISREHLLRSAGALAERHPELEVLPVCADFTRPFELPRPATKPARDVAYFPGSTIGNFAEPEARELLGQIAALTGPGGGLLIGADLEKDADTLEAAYDDAEGVTAEFNLNLLARINRELEADFRLERFRHEAVWEPKRGRVEMHLVSLDEQAVSIGDARIRFARGESIHTESSHKYSVEGFAALAGSAGFRVERVWTDPGRLFSVQLLVVA